MVGYLRHSRGGTAGAALGPYCTAPRSAGSSAASAFLRPIRWSGWPGALEVDPGVLITGIT